MGVLLYCVDVNLPSVRSSDSVPLLEKGGERERKSVRERESSRDQIDDVHRLQPFITFTRPPRNAQQYPHNSLTAPLPSNHRLHQLKQHVEHNSY